MTPNDFRNHEFRPVRQSPQQANPGCSSGLFTVICLVFIVVGIAMLAGGAGLFGVFWIVIAVAVLVNGQKQIKLAQKKAAGGGSPVRQAAPPKARPRGPEACGNPEPHRHFETAKPCPNPEPHRHYEAPKPAAPKVYSEPAQSRKYDTFAQPVKRWPTDQERRLQNMKHLFEAGLLTREEYDDEVRRLRRSGT